MGVTGFLPPSPRPPLVGVAEELSASCVLRVSILHLHYMYMHCIYTAAVCIQLFKEILYFLRLERRS